MEQFKLFLMENESIGKSLIFGETTFKERLGEKYHSGFIHFYCSKFQRDNMTTQEDKYHDG